MTQRPLRIAIGVHGRFYAFDLAKALIERGHEVTVFTNYPAVIAAKFGLPSKHVRSFVLHGVAMRAVLMAHARLGIPWPEATLHRLFGRWLAQQVKKQNYDLVHVFSGVAEEVIEALRGSQTRVSVIRASAHIAVQDQILRAEEVRTGVPIDRPSPWMIAREQREYARADRVTVLSTFAASSFRTEGFPADRLAMYSLGVPTADFAPVPGAIEARLQRITSGAPLRVLYVGSKSAQKGMASLSALADRLPKERFEFRAVGQTMPETRLLMTSINLVNIEKVSQNMLHLEYQWGDVMILPTLQDGFSVVVSQGLASGLPVLTTYNCGAAELLVEGVSGWVVPAGDVDAMEARLLALESNRLELANLVSHVSNAVSFPTWADAANQAETSFVETLSQPKREGR